MKNLALAVIACLVGFASAGAAQEPQYKLSVHCGAGGFIYGDKQYSSGRAIDCGPGRPRCSVTLPKGVYVLTAEPKPFHAVSGWYGACTGKETTCAFSLSADVLVGADFEDRSTKITVDETHGFYIEGFDAAKRAAGDSTRVVACGWDHRVNRMHDACSATVMRGTRMIFYKFPAEGSKPYFWKNPCSGTDRVYCESTVNANLHVSVVPSIKVSVAAPSNGAIEFDGKSCPGACSVVLSPNSATPVTFTAIPASGYILGSWGGACAGTQGLTCTRTASNDLGVSAVFSKLH